MRFSGSRSPPPTSAPSGCCRRSWPTTWPPTPTDCARATAGPPVVLFVFDGGPLTAAQTAAIRLDRDEIGELGFFDPGQAAPLLTRDAQDRLAACRSCRHGGLAGGDLVGGVAGGA